MLLLPTQYTLSDKQVQLQEGASIYNIPILNQISTILINFIKKFLFFNENESNTVLNSYQSILVKVYGPQLCLLVKDSFMAWMLHIFLVCNRIWCGIAFFFMY